MALERLGSISEHAFRRGRSILNDGNWERKSLREVDGSGKYRAQSAHEADTFEVDAILVFLDRQTDIKL